MFWFETLKTFPSKEIRSSVGSNAFRVEIFGESLTAPIDLNIFLRAHSRREEAQAVGRVVGQVGIGDFNLPSIKKHFIQSEVWECFDDLDDLSYTSYVKNVMDFTSYLPVGVKGRIDEQSAEPG